MKQKTANNLFDLYRVHKAVTLESILLALTTKTTIKIVTYNKLTKNYNIIFSGYAYEVYKSAQDYLDIRIIGATVKDSEVIIII